MKFKGRVQPGVGDASKWLRLFAEAYARRTGTGVFPGFLNLNIGGSFNWQDAYIVARQIWFDRSGSR
jgi:hypothetical protein